MNFLKKGKFFLFITIFSLFFLNKTNAFSYGGIGLRSADLETQTVKQNVGFYYDIDNDGEVTDGIMVVNSTNETKTLLVYVTDSTKSSDGGFACKQYSDQKKEVGSWIELEKNEVILEPNSNIILSFNIKVPHNADAGEHNGCFFVQEKKEENKEEISGIKLSVRTGVKVSVLIPGDVSKKLSIDNFKVVKKNKDIFILNTKIKNSGNVSSEADIDIKIKNILNPFGIKTKKIGDVYNILRTETTSLNFELDKKDLFFGGFYKATLNVKYNPEIKGSIDDVKNLKKLKPKSVVFYSAPTLGGLIIDLLFVVLIIFIVYLVYLQIQRNKWIKTWKYIRITKSTNIKVIAEKYDVNWKLLTRVNKIKAPFVLNNKDEILVPSDLEEDFYKNNKNFIQKLKEKINKKYYKKSNKKITKKNSKKFRK